MGENKKKVCCDKISWEFIKDASHARGCEFTYGKCINCHSNLIHIFHTIVNHDGDYQIVSPKFVEEMLSHQGSELKQFMKKWYDDIS